MQDAIGTDSDADGALSVLGVIDALEVGFPKVNKRKLIVPYTITKGGSRDTFYFEYSYTEDVLNPDDPGDLNLASMMAAQPAINYGLFCREMVFKGLYSRIDRAFIEQMASNTAKEIFVKKFLEPNPFLIGEARGLPPIRLKSYLRSRLVFEGFESRAYKEAPLDAKVPDQTQYAVLSSGGKESLLSFALLKELGLRVHPIFVNESGRHWFTALNAFRHFEKAFSDTARVWTNADRLFPWVLRRFPFIRRDFLRVRSDEYPIRLWTLPVFIFGALPIIKRRGIGAVVIGDEFDTTSRRFYKGIAHYNGLYDQSIYFDRKMSGYFRAKGWGLSQFSILRPLSEILVQKILALRYPELQGLQVSCHLAHMEDGVVRPCGNCEKCVRVVGMLTAIGVDPARCGYTPKQARRCLAMLGGKPLSQEEGAAEHLVFMLSKKGIIPGSEGRIRAREHPEIMKLRFDGEHSPIDYLPQSLRLPLWKIYLRYAEGATVRRGRVWRDFAL
ncbi:MAG: hypothetical protein QXX77_05250 [Candidatus Methanosuratincola sp.]|jgi:hypothetical protein